MCLTSPTISGKGVLESDEVDRSLGPADGTWFARVRYALRLTVKRTVVAFWRAGYVRVELGGLTAYVNDTSDETVRRSTANLRTAVALLDKYDPCRFRRICRDLKNGIIVFPTGSAARAEYHRDIDMCFLRADYVLSGHPGFIAMLIVHEATHARMRRLSHATPERRWRMERICIGAEIAFAMRVPGVEKTVDMLRAKQSRLVVSDFEAS